MSERGLAHVGLVVIGRNEGERLRVCLTSVVGLVGNVLYVDSGSTDDSVAMARSIGVHVINLDMSVPFTAARARNEGWRALLTLAPDLEFIQFVDGDCELISGWLGVASEFLSGNCGYAVVSGRLYERYPEASVYNRLCDIEWNAPIGDSDACGGIAMMRVVALRCVEGFNPVLIAGEEPELCLRLRGAGWKIRRVASDMAFHDAAMFHFSQWWKRSKRAGYAYAHGAWLHGAPPERHYVRETKRALFWGICLPSAVLFCTVFFSPWILFLLALYPIQVLRMTHLPGGWVQAFFLLLGKFAETSGIFKFFYDQLFLRRQSRLIEYK